MKQYAGIDVSLEASYVCVVDAEGKIVREAKVLSEPGALISWFAEYQVAMERIGLEAGPLSQWLYAAMGKAGLAVELLETRHVRTAFKTMYQSGETDYTGRISKIGDAGVRTALYEAANVVLTRPVKGSDLKTWALGIAKRAGLRKAKVALARKLAVVLHRMLRDQTSFVTHRAAPSMAAA